jgi:hypothetical protein
MAHKTLAIALSMIVATSPLMASQPEPPTTPAPAGNAHTRYCLRVELTGSNIEPVRCWTREKWAEEGVDVDKEWAREGVTTIG